LESFPPLLSPGQCGQLSLPVPAAVWGAWVCRHSTV
jgi:hypothetical protein